MTPPSNQETCGRECPRHDGKVCLLAYMPDMIKDGLKNGMGIPVIDASMRHRHTHTETFPVPGGSHYLISHSWGKGGHRYGFGNGILYAIAEDLYDALLDRTVDPSMVSNLLGRRQAEHWKAGGALLSTPKKPLALADVERAMDAANAAVGVATHVVYDAAVPRSE